MMDRREFLTVTALGSAGATLPGTTRRAPKTIPDGRSERERWVQIASRLAEPILINLAAGTLRARMPVEEAPGANRRPVTHLEAFGRLLSGLAPWLELPADDTPEGRSRSRYRDLARRALAVAVDPESPDFMNFTQQGQPLVDAAFLGQALLRAPHALVDPLDDTTKQRLVSALETTRAIQPGFNNWLLFSATVEAALLKLGARWDRMRVDYALRQHAQWYKGDGLYGDGPELHWDYYNSFVIHPMSIDVLDACANELPAWLALAEPARKRARRYAAIQERLIGPDGAFPPIGRSLAYRCGAFHLLAQSALRRDLPEGLPPAQVRAALGAVIRRCLDAPGTFDANGWLTIGLGGHQPQVGERYISTGSLYLCATGLLALGLPAADEFWSGPPQPWTSRLAWAGEAFPIDKAMSE
jgi:hypothetical protein